MSTLFELVALAGIGAMALWFSFRASAARGLTPLRVPVPVADPVRRRIPRS